MNIRHRKPYYVLFSILSLSASLCHAEIYKCVENGKTIFSQYPCSPNAISYHPKTTDKLISSQGEQAKTNTPSQGKSLLWFDPELGIDKCGVYPEKDGAQNEYQMSLKMLELLAPLAQDEKTKKEIESFRNMKLLDTCPSGAKIKCYPDLIVFSTDMNDEFTKKHIEDTKKTRKYELWYPNGKDLKKLSDSCSTGIFEILP